MLALGVLLEDFALAFAGPVIGLIGVALVIALGSFALGWAQDLLRATGCAHPGPPR